MEVISEPQQSFDEDVNSRSILFPPKTIKSPSFSNICSFQEIPAEIRMKIWRLLVVDEWYSRVPIISPNPIHHKIPEVDLLRLKQVTEWRGRTPNVIKALRGFEPRYKEALEIFYKTNVIVVHSKITGHFVTCLDLLLLVSRRLTLLFDQGIKPKLECNWNGGSLYPGYLFASSFPRSNVQHIQDLAALASLATNVREVEVEINAMLSVPINLEEIYRSPRNDKVLYYWGQHHYCSLLAGFQKVKRFSMMFPTDPIRTNTSTGGLHIYTASMSVPGSTLHNPASVVEGNTKLGALAKLERVSVIPVVVSMYQHALIDPFCKLDDRDKYV